MPVQGAWRRIVTRFANVLRGAGIEELAVPGLRVKLRAASDAGNWPHGEGLLSARGQIGLDHYEMRLEATLGSRGYRIALELLTEAAVDEGFLSDDTVDRHREHFDARNEDAGDDTIAVADVLHQLEQEGYLERRGGGYVFVSGLLEDWWRARHGRHFVPVARRGR